MPIYYDIKITAPLIPWLCSFFIAIYMIIMWYRYSTTTEKESKIYMHNIYKHVLTFIVTLGLLTYSALQFLDKDIYFDNFKYALVTLGISFIMIALIDLIIMGPFHIPPEITIEYVRKKYDENILPKTVRIWGIKVAAGIFSVCITLNSTVFKYFTSAGLIIIFFLIYFIIKDFCLTSNKLIATQNNHNNLL
jgi:hypothetical protein